MWTAMQLHIGMQINQRIVATDNQKCWYRIIRAEAA